MKMEREKGREKRDYEKEEFQELLNEEAYQLTHVTTQCRGLIKP